MTETATLNREHYAFMCGDPDAYAPSLERDTQATWEAGFDPSLMANGSLQQNGMMKLRSSAQLSGMCMVFVDDTLLYVAPRPRCPSPGSR